MGSKLLVRACSLSVAVLCASGCTKRQVAAGAGLGMTLTGVAVMASEYADDEDQQLESTSFGPPILAVGLITLFVAAALDEADHESEPIVIPSYQPRPSVAAQNRRTAGELTKAAQAAARRSDCDRVAILDPQIRDLDPDLHVTVFARDVAIQRCLAGAVAPVPVAVPPAELEPAPAVEPDAPVAEPVPSPPVEAVPAPAPVEPPAPAGPPPAPAVPVGPPPAPEAQPAPAPTP